MKIYTHRINAIGRAEIDEFLGDHLRVHYSIDAWADAMAHAMDDGKDEIEIRAIWTKSGRPEFLSVSEAGVDKEEITD